MILLPKATAWKYHKKGNPACNNVYDSLLFFLKDDFLREFMKMADIKVVSLKKNVAISVKPVNEILQTYLHAVKTYFKEAETLNPGLVRLKMIELLYNLASADENLLLQILQL